MTYANKLRRFPILVFSPIFIVLLCTACGNSPSSDPDTASAPAAPTPAQPAATGLVKNPVKLSDTADAVKWMDMASTKSPAQIAKEEQVAKAAKEAKLAAEAREAKLAGEARAEKLAADAKIAAEAKRAEEAKALAAKNAEAQKLAAAAPPPVVAPKAAPVVPQEPILKLVSREQPKFPARAGSDGITSGVVTALIHIEPDGRVSRVDILKATPKRYFENAVIAAVLQWKYAPVSKPMTTTLDFDFRLDGGGA